MVSDYLLAQLDLHAWVLIAAKVLAAVVGGLIGWFVSAPLASLLYRLAFHRPIEPWAQFVCRALSAMVIGILVFLFFPIGSGGFGFFGTGGGFSAGGSNGGEGTEDGKDETTAGKKGIVIPVEKNLTLQVEMIASEDYQHDGRYYFLQGEKPAQTLEAVHDFLKKNKGRYSRLEILIYANSPSAQNPSVLRLKELAENMNITPSMPPEYHSKVKG